MTEGSARWRTVNSGRATAWWSEGWALFMKNPAMWLVFGVIFCVITALLGVIPLGGLIAALLTQVLAGGWMLATRKMESGGTIEVQDLFLGFKTHLNPLVVLGAIALAATLAITVVMFVIGGGAALGMMAGGAQRSTGGVLAGLGVGFLGMLVALMLFFVVGMALWFAPALVVFRGVAPVEALKMSWAAVLGNIGVFLVYGIIWIVAAIVASIPLMLGWLVLIPLMFLSMYRSYQDVFEGA